MTNGVVELLVQGDMRTVNYVDQVVSAALVDPGVIQVLVDCIIGAEEGLAMRAADALQKICAQRPELLYPYKAKLVTIALSVNQPEVQWHMAQILPTHNLTAIEASKLATLWENDFYKSESSIVKTFALQAMADVSGRYPVASDKLHEMIVYALDKGTPAMRARARKLNTK